MRPVMVFLSMLFLGACASGLQVQDDSTGKVVAADLYRIDFPDFIAEDTRPLKVMLGYYEQDGGWSRHNICQLPNDRGGGCSGLVPHGRKALVIVEVITNPKEPRERQIKKPFCGHIRVLRDRSATELHEVTTRLDRKVALGRAQQVHYEPGEPISCKYDVIN